VRAGAYCGGWRRCACLDAKTRVLAVGALASPTCNNFIADLLFLSEVPQAPLLVAGPPCVHPYLGGWKWALGLNVGLSRSGPWESLRAKNRQWHAMEMGNGQWVGSVDQWISGGWCSGSSSHGGAEARREQREE
jgi:hypothetical protein